MASCLLITKSSPTLGGGGLRKVLKDGDTSNRHVSSDLRVALHSSRGTHAKWSMQSLGDGDLFLYIPFKGLLYGPFLCLKVEFPLLCKNLRARTSGPLLNVIITSLATFAHAPDALHDFLSSIRFFMLVFCILLVGHLLNGSLGPAACVKVGGPCGLRTYHIHDTRIHT